MAELKASLLNASLTIPDGSKLANLADKIYEDLLRPTVKEVGLDWKRSYVGYRQRRAQECLYKTGRFITLKGIREPRPVPLKILHRVIEGACLEEDEDLHTMWAALLANAADPDFIFEVRASFVQILRDLTPTEAKVCQLLYEDFMIGSPEVYGGALNRILERLNVEEDHLILVLNALSRHQLFLMRRRDHEYRESLGTEVEGGAPPSGDLTVFGFEFVRACQPPMARPKKRPTVHAPTPTP